MFGAGFRETEEREVKIEDVRYEIFLMLLEYLYTGIVPDLQILVPKGDSREQKQSSQRLPYNQSCEIDESNLETVIELLAAADKFMVDNLREVCEQLLHSAVNPENVELLLNIAERTNADQLLAVCQHFIRNNLSDSNDLFLEATPMQTSYRALASSNPLEEHNKK